MTARQCFEGLLVELSKVNAPSMLLADFNYFFNKAINLYINKRYNIYDLNQQTTDDLRVLKSVAILEPKKSISGTDNLYAKAFTNSNLTKLLEKGAGTSKLFGATYEVNLPSDYLHLLNCICIYELDSNHKCYNKGDVVQFSAKRLTSDSWSNIINDFYNRPLPERPYFYIHNVNTSTELPTNPITNKGGTDYVPETKLQEGDNIKSVYDAEIDGLGAWLTKNGTYTISNKDGYACVYDSTGTGEFLYVKITNGVITKASNGFSGMTKIGDTIDGEKSLPRTIKIGGFDSSTVEKEAMNRYGNASSVRMEIRYGHDDSIFKLKGIMIDYVKAPQHIRLTQELVNLTEDKSLIMEFPDYVCQEIINELVHLVMETTGDPRLQSHAVVTESIGNPAQQLAQTPKG